MTRPAMAIMILLWAAASTPAGSPPDEAAFFESRIRPVLIRSCFKCHGAEKATNELRVDSRESLLEGGDRGAAVVTGRPDVSLLIQAIRYDDEDLTMPPDAPLSKDVVADFEHWVENGAVWPEAASIPVDGELQSRHWSFRPLDDVEPPKDPSGWSDHPIDRFIMARLAEKRIEPNPEASPRVLVRRLYFDLTGLPPTPEDARSFEQEALVDLRSAWRTLIEGLLASPRYGERWGRHWMDVVHYADSAGDNADYPVPEARLYRDYIIDAFNNDKPYNEFLQEQLAGDILAREMWQRDGVAATGDADREQLRQRYAEQLIATGFVALSRRYGVAPYEQTHLVLEDTIETTSRAFLGLTLRCARCHDHKFDPITNEDYYALYGIFDSTQFPYAGSEEFKTHGRARRSFVPLVPPDEVRPLIESYAELVIRMTAELDNARQASGPESERDRIIAEIQRLLRPGLPPDVPGAYAVVDGRPHDAALQHFGDPHDLGPIIPRGVPKFIAGDKRFEVPTGASGRLQFAQWVSDPANPLTARVMVNRIWQYHFGTGLVRTPSNFGLSGEAPSHPKLLDWLASRFIESDWSVKDMHRLILSSMTYRLSSQLSVQDDTSEDSIADTTPLTPYSIDPASRLRWRFNRRRLDAESIRDAMLFASGELNLDRPGEHPFPDFKGWQWTQHSPFKAVYPSLHRSVYLMTQRLVRHPYLALFDGPDTNNSTGTRTAATIPQQSLYMMNNPFVRQRAEGLAKRLQASSADPGQRIELAHEIAFGRRATPVDVEQGLSYVDNYTRELVAAGVGPEDVEPEAWNSYAWVMLTCNEFLYTE